MTDTAARASLQRHYDAMWDHAFNAVASGDIDADTRLLAGPDPRRGITLIARPCQLLTARFDALLDRLMALEPQQYRYPAADMHVTMLSLSTVTDHAAAELARVDDYCAGVQAALHGIDAFEIDFDGVTLSRGAVLARGFPRGPALEKLRERLRSALRERGLDASIDQRYRLVTAHVTLLRFAAPLRNAPGIAALLETVRNEPLGSMHVGAVELVINDWYMSSQSLTQVATLPLGQAASGVIA